MKVRAPGKINLDLRVGRAAGDGFHPIISWFRTVDLADTLTFAPADGFRFDCDAPDAGPTDRNLVVRAADAYRRSAGHLPPVQVRLDKQIPVGGGLGGGSSDAAATLVGLSTLFGKPDVALPELAAGLGSDVPFFVAVAGGTTDACCTGRGDVVQSFVPARRHAILLVLTGIACDTGVVYRVFDTHGKASDLGTPPDYAAWSASRADDLLPRLHNDLSKPAFDAYPRLADAAARAQDLLGRRVCLTGSGGTLFSLYDDATSAHAAADVARRAGLEVRVA